MKTIIKKKKNIYSYLLFNAFDLYLQIWAYKAHLPNMGLLKSLAHPPNKLLKSQNDIVEKRKRQGGRRN